MAERTNATGADLKKPSIGLIQPWGSSMDEGWTRWMIEQYGFEFVVCVRKISTRRLAEKSMSCSWPTMRGCQSKVGAAGVRVVLRQRAPRRKPARLEEPRVGGRQPEAEGVEGAGQFDPSTRTPLLRTT